MSLKIAENMYRKGKQISIEELSELAKNKLPVYVQTNQSRYVTMAYELLTWQLRSLLRVKIFVATCKNGTTANKKI